MKDLFNVTSIILIAFFSHHQNIQAKSSIPLIDSPALIHHGNQSATEVIYVDSTAALGGNGKNWGTAFRYLQDGLARSAVLVGGGLSVEIWVAKGTYYPDDDEGGNVTGGDRDVAFAMQNNVALYGGFRNIHTSIAQRDWNSNPTVLSGDINQTGTLNAYHVIYNNFTMGSPLNGTAILSGFIIEDAIAEDAITPMGDHNYGGGLFNRYASPSIAYCAFRDNNANFGGAMSNENSDPVITNTLIYHNQAFEIGDAMFNSSSDPSLINCTISENKGPDNGNFSDTSIYNSKSDMIITNCILWNNNKEIHNVTSTPVVKNSIVQGGYASGTDIINQDPLFVLAPANFDLKICSPAINQGTNSISVGSKDYAGNARFLHAVFDIGAYEYNTGIVYVNHLATGLNDGTSWTNAYQYLQDALITLADCESPGQVWVARGTYYPDEGEGGSNNNRNRSFTMPHGVQIYGGFVGNESLLSQRNWQNHQTSLSGDIDQNDHTGSIQYNSFNVINNNYTAADPLTSTARLDGFIVTAGNANQAFLNDEGGGMRNVNSAPTIINCTFSTNYARYGAGMHNDSSDITLVNCNFLRDSAAVKGGGIRHLRGNLNLIECGFDANHTGAIMGSEGGAGVAFKPLGSNGFTMNACQFVNNTTDGHGGAVLVESGASVPLGVHNFIDCSFITNLGRFSGAVATFDPLNLHGCSFEENQVVPGSSVDDRYTGGAVLVIGDSTNIDSCSFVGNKTDQYGGALAATDFGIIHATNSRFSDNQADYFTFQDPDFVEPRGGAIYVESDAKALIINCDFEDNFAERKGGAMYSNSDLTEVTNCRFWNNRTSEIGHSIYNDAADTKTVNCVFANNTVNNVGAIIHNENNSNPIIQNCILWKFGVASPPNIIYDEAGSSSTVSFSLVQGGWTGGTNIIDADPKFVGIGEGNLMLQDCSPAIDAGANSANNTIIDLAGNQRLHNATGAQKARIDLGPFEFQGTYSSSCSCPQTLHLGSNISSGTYSAQQTLTSDGQLMGGSNVIFSAGTSVDLQSNFEAPLSSQLEILLGGCP